MMTDFHFLRPWWLLVLLLLFALAFILWRQKLGLLAWKEVCDPHLLEHLLQKKGHSKRNSSLLLLFIAVALMIIGIAGPTWHQLPVATYKPIQPRVLVLDMSDHMMDTDLTPNRLSRAKFKLHDLFAHKDLGQVALVVFTGEPFVVSPLTDDGQTIAALLSSLTPDVMPVGGHKLDSALNEAGRLIKQAGYQHGDILVLTADSPSSIALETAKKLASQGIFSSIMPMRTDKNLNPLFKRFAILGEGQLLRYSAEDDDLTKWINATRYDRKFAPGQDGDVPLWRDEGRWFLIPALLFLLPVFRRGWIQRVAL